ncbi:MAG: formate dehydrogenase accessory protein FdhE [Smithellaceae bacterium]|nr:formate dehydrogenase accessory protein FdhE [Smithellaceae bacterium]
MKLSLQDQNILEHLHKARNAHPHLEALFHFYDQLFQLQFAFKARLKETYPATYPAGNEIDLTRLASGIPQVSFDELQMEAAPFVDLYRDIAALLIGHTGYLPPDNGEPQPETILAQAREILDSRAPLVGAGQPADLIRAASGLVLAPYLQLACERIMPRISQDEWHRGYCPVCGGAPSFAVLYAEPGFRTLLCSRCNGEWRFLRMGCPFCMERDQQTYYPGEEGRYRLYVCEVCHRYLKSREMPESASERCLPVESLATVAMDVAAQGKGCLFF